MTAYGVVACGVYLAADASAPPPQMPPTIDRVITDIGYAEFLDKYLIPNRPLLVGSVLARDWPAFHLWIDDENVGDLL